MRISDTTPIVVFNLGWILIALCVALPVLIVRSVLVREKPLCAADFAHPHERR